MQDRFKFRVWDVEEKKYLDDDDICIDTQGEISDVYHFMSSCLEDEDDYYIFEQCTGLKDKNGKLIYEGDILKSSFKNKESESDCLPVYYNKNQFSVGFNGGDAGWFSDHFVGEIEIVGNIHENPELLEE